MSMKTVHIKLPGSGTYAPMAFKMPSMAPSFCVFPTLLHPANRSGAVYKPASAFSKHESVCVDFNVSH